jgi:hypothetical protein
LDITLQHGMIGKERMHKGLGFRIRGMNLTLYNRTEKYCERQNESMFSHNEINLNLFPHETHENHEKVIVLGSAQLRPPCSTLRLKLEGETSASRL